MHRSTCLLLLFWATAGFGQSASDQVAAPHADPPSTDDPFLINGRTNLYQWPPGRRWLQDAPSDEERWRRLEAYLGGMQGPMFEIGQRFVVFYDALRDENYALAIDIWIAISRVFVNAVTIRPEYKQAADAMFLRTQWHEMLDALRSGDTDRIWSEFVYTKAVCESCHQATNMEWANEQRVFHETVYPFDPEETTTYAIRSFRTDSADSDATGAELFRPCTACHTTGEGDAHLIGPNLHGMFGRKVGLAEGFVYSEALLESDVIMTDETLNRWLVDASEVVPGNVMLFPGIRDERDRDKIIGYLKEITGASIVD